LKVLYEAAREMGAGSWNQIELAFVKAISDFDTNLSRAKEDVLAAVQNGKGDFFNDLIALLLENCAGIETLYTRQAVHGLVIPNHNLDGVYPAKGEIRFLLEAKMMGTPRHAANPKAKEFGRLGAADMDKRVKELGFKAIDLKGEHSRRRAIQTGKGALGPGGGDLVTWLKTMPPKVYLFLGVRVVSDADFQNVLRYADAAAQVVDAVGLYCYEPVGTGSYTTYRSKGPIKPDLQIERTLFRACQELTSLKGD
jgi:hypothetical protein